MPGVLATVCGITFKCKAEDESFKTPPGTVQTGVCADQLSFPHSQSPVELEWIQ